MVSTRGVKFKFSEGEKVLCYEPDPSKAKVLYDSKVLEVVQKGRKSVEYLIHFQGWNSSWDRCVPEEYVLRDTEENRQLQKRLAEKAQLQLKERGSQQRNKQLSEFGKRSHSDNSGSEDDTMDDELNFDMLDHVVDDTLLVDDNDDDGDGEDEDDEDEDGGETDDESDESDDDNYDIDGNEENKENEQAIKEYDHHRAPLEIPKEIKKFLNCDYEEVNFKKKRVRLPANPNILAILEAYVKDYARELLTAEEEVKQEPDIDPKPCTASGMKSVHQRSQRQRKRQRRMSSTSSCDGEESDKEFQEILRNLRICQEVVHSLRYYTEFLLGDQLLYACEMNQHRDLKRMIKSGNLSEIMKKYNPRDFIPMQQRILAKIDSDSEEQGKSDTEAELLEMISAVDEGFAQRWNDLLRDAGCEIDPPETELIQIKTEPEDVLDDEDEDEDDDYDDSSDISKARGIRTLNMATSGASCSKSPDKASTSRAIRNAECYGSTPVFPSSRAERRKNLLDAMMRWKIIPDEHQNPKKPTMCQMYGAVHLCRLLVKLPDFIFATKFPEGHVRVIQRHLNMLLAYLANQPAYFDPNQYFTHYFCQMESDIEDEDLSTFY